MDAKTFIKTFGPDLAEQVAIAAGTNLVYLRQIGWGVRRPSSRKAWRLVYASGHRMKFEDLCPPDESDKVSSVF